MHFTRQILQVIAGATMIASAAWIWGTGASAEPANFWAWQEPEGDVAFAAHVHAGDCGLFNPSDVLGSGEAVPEVGGADMAYSFDLELDVAMGVLVETPHAVTIESLTSEVAAPLACGEIQGTDSAGRLVTGIRSLETGALEGIAVLEPMGDEATHVMVYLVLSGESDQPEDGGDAEDDDGDITEPDDGDGDDPEGGL